MVKMTQIERLQPRVFQKRASVDIRIAQHNTLFHVLNMIKAAKAKVGLMMQEEQRINPDPPAWNYRSSREASA